MLTNQNGICSSETKFSWDKRQMQSSQQWSEKSCCCCSQILSVWEGGLKTSIPHLRCITQNRGGYRHRKVNCWTDTERTRLQNTYKGRSEIRRQRFSFKSSSKNVVWRTVHTVFLRKELPTLARILEKVKKKIPNFPAEKRAWDCYLWSWGFYETEKQSKIHLRARWHQNLAMKLPTQDPENQKGSTSHTTYLYGWNLGERSLHPRTRLDRFRSHGTTQRGQAGWTFTGYNRQTICYCLCGILGHPTSLNSVYTSV